ncbi:MAG: serine hydrolase [Bacteroidales bacterium]|nr:beta-lactamase family protein [Bacteroidales bacterium]MDD2424989.1 serine hydrolase [Bacteroidales bacterium]MDD3989541.1 serine hydrolase [Bacteroidales bacterium]
MKNIIISFLFVLLITLSCQTGYGQQVIYPDEEWAKADPEKYGFSAEKLEALKAYIIDSMRTTGLSVIIEGEQIFEFGNLKRVSYIASCRKSVLAIMYGKYVENGTIDLNKKISELGINDVQGLLPIEGEATVKDLIKARSGVYHPASNPGDDTANSPERGSKKPGCYFLYNNWDFNVAGAIFEMLTGENIYEAFQKDIGVQIDLQDYQLSLQKKGGDPKRSIFPAYHFYFSTRDMARIGYLMLRNGKWKNRQVVSEGWVKEITDVHTPLAEMNPLSRRNYFGYGYMWWVWDNNVSPEAFKGAYTARGAIGQYITILPKYNMVIAHKTDSVYNRSTKWDNYYKFLQMLLECKN